MTVDIVAVRILPNYKVELTFEDGIVGKVDVRGLLAFDGVFAPLANESFFSQVRVDTELGTIVWPNGADLDPDVLYRIVTGKSLEEARGIAS